MRLPYSSAAHAEVQSLAEFIFDMADQIQDLMRARRRVLDLDVTKALAVLTSHEIPRKFDHGTD